MTQTSLFSKLLINRVINNIEKQPACPKNLTISEDMAYSDQVKFDLKMKVLGNGTYDPTVVKLSPRMMCYCDDLTNMGMTPWTAEKSKFYNFTSSEEEKENMPNYCALHMETIAKSKISNSFLEYQQVIFNAFIAVIFSYLGEFQKMHTSIEEQISQFRYILFLEVFNMGIIQLISSFEPTGIANSIRDDSDNEMSNYASSGFTSLWYMNIGIKLCFTIFTSSISTNIDVVTMLGKRLMTRCRDRGYKLSIKKDPEDEDDDEVNTKKATQEELEQMYLGEEFQGQRDLSRMMSTLTVCILYSGGMPVLYIVGFIFFTVTYLVNKFALIRFYQKTTTLSRVIPSYSNEFLTSIVFCHLLMSSSMLTNPYIFQFKEVPENLMNLPIPFAGSRKPLAEQNFLEKRLMYFH